MHNVLCLSSLEKKSSRDFFFPFLRKCVRACYWLGDFEQELCVAETEDSPPV